MSEFKFACPVCGQHITAAKESSGSQIECPTCFQKIIVPQARASDSKFILNAAQADKPRPTQMVLQDSVAARRNQRSPALGWVLALLMVAIAAAGVYSFRSQLGLVKHAQTGTNAPPIAIVTNESTVTWTMNLDDAKVPQADISGALRGKPFAGSRAILQGGTLSVRQGKGWPPELAVAILFPAKRGDDLARKEVRVRADQGPPVPKVVLRWKDDQGKGASRTFTEGYALLINFGEPIEGRMPGTMYLALPDDEQSVVAGTFEAEIRAPEPRKKKAPVPPPPKDP